MKPLAKEIKNLEYDRYNTRNTFLLLGLAVVWLSLALFSLSAGSYQISLVELLKAVFKQATRPEVNTLIYNLRLPRVLTAMVGGAGLGIVGCVLQAVLRNPLASSSTLGISQGASFGAAFAIIFLKAGMRAAGPSTMQFANPVLISFSAFLASMMVSFLILGLSRFQKITSEGMILAGVALSAMFQGATTLVQYFASEVELTSIIFWSFGDLGRTGWREIIVMALVVVGSTGFFIFNRWNYNALEVGEQTAISLGVNVNQIRVLNMAVCSVTAATIVSYLGIINFIGLIAPHIVKRLIGNNHAYLLPASAFMGGILLLAGDLLARIIIMPVVLPIGAITSFMGAPLFLYLLFKSEPKGR